MVELKVPEPPLLNVMVPVGVTFVPAEVSLTVAVQVAATFTGTELGEQTTLTELERFEAVRLKLPELVE